MKLIVKSVQLQHVRKFKTVLDSGFHADCIADSRYRIPISVRGTWIPDSVSGIPDSLSRIPDSKAQDSGFPQAKISQISESEFHSTRGDCNPGMPTC